MSKISIIGAGAVGAATAYSLAQESWVHELVLVDINQTKAQGEALDIMHGMPLMQSIQVTAGNYEESKNSDLVIITVGVPEVVGESRLVPLQKNTEILESIIPEILKYSPDTKLLVVSNPVDLLTYVTYKISGLPKERVLGLGTMLDSSRLRYLLSRDFKVAAKNISAYVIGEHGDSQVALWSKTQIASMDVETFAELNNIELKEDYFTNLENEVRQTAFDVWEMKGPNAYCVASAISEVSRAVIRNENLVLPVSSLSKLENSEDEVFISLPSIVNNTGNAKTLNIPISDEEKQKINESKKLLNELSKQIKFKGAK